MTMNVVTRRVGEKKAARLHFRLGCFRPAGSPYRHDICDHALFAGWHDLLTR